MFRAVGVLALAISMIGSAELVAGEGVGDGKPEGAKLAAELPRYRLKVGQQLDYETSSSQKYQSGEFKSAADWSVWVVTANQDGGWRLLVKKTMWHASGDRPISKDAGAAQPELAYFDLTPDGRVVGQSSNNFRIDLRDVFPRLPESEQELAAGWADAGAMDERHEYKLVSREKGDVRISDVKTSPMNAIYLVKWQSTYRFDAERGLIDAADIVFSQDYGIQGKGTGELKLGEVQTLSREALAKLAADTDLYFKAADDYQELVKQAQQDAEKFETLYAEAKERLEHAAARLTSAELKSQAEAMLKSHDAAAKYYLEEAKRRAEVVGKEAPTFETTDLDGAERSLADYRGKVVVLDFWYRGCGWCIRAMPQINQVARAFKDKPVAVIGMNTDRKVEDAKFVIEKMGLEYANVKAEGLPEKFKVQGFPTLVVVDQKGIIREFHVGYSPTLAADLSETINGLLAEK